MSRFSISKKKKILVLEWLEANTIPAKFRFSLLELASAERFEGKKMPFSLPFNEFEHVVEHLTKSGLATFSNEGGYRIYGITHKGQDFLSEERENSFWATNIRSLRSNVVTIAISVVTAVAASWAVFLWGAPLQQLVP